MKKERRVWQRLQEEFELSGMSIKKFADLKSIPIQTARDNLKKVTKVKRKVASKPKGSNRQGQIIKHNWEKLKADFLRFNGSLSDFARSKSFDSNDGNFLRQSRNWIDERATLRQESIEQTKKSILETNGQRYRDHLNKLEHSAINNLDLLSQMDDKIKILFSDSDNTIRDIKDLIYSLKAKNEVIESTKSILGDLLPLPDKNNDISGVLHHYADIGDHTKFFILLRLLTSITKGQNQEPFDPTAGMTAEEVSAKLAEYDEQDGVIRPGSMADKQV